MKNKLVMLLTLFAIVNIDCSKDSSTIFNNKMSATIGDKKIDFIVVSKLTEFSGYKTLVITGTDGLLSTNDYTYFAITITALKIDARTYEVPSYTGVAYDNSKGWAMGYYFKGLGTDDANIYYSQLAANASGTVTISSISSNNVKGTFNITLVNKAENTKTLNFKGDFSSNF